MFQIVIKTVACFFTKFFADTDSQSVLTAIPEGTKRVVFIDTPATPHLVATVEALVASGREVVVRDHHDAPVRSNPREVAIADAAARLRKLIGANALITDRTANPGCSSLIRVGEFSAKKPRTTAMADDVIVVADPDPDGLLGALKAVGVNYPGLDEDAAVLDSGRAGQTADRLSPDAYLLVRAMAGLPGFDPARPEVSERAKSRLFADFALLVQGDAEARVRMEASATAYEAGVREAERLADTVQDLFLGVPFVDVIGSQRFDVGTLVAAMERRPGTKVSVRRTSAGVVAKSHGGVQFTLQVVKALQAEINLQEILPAGFVSSPEAGIISNTTFLLHVSENVWEEMVLPALKAKLAK